MWAHLPATVLRENAGIPDGVKTTDWLKRNKSDIAYNIGGYLIAQAATSLAMRGLSNLVTPAFNSYRDNLEKTIFNNSEHPSLGILVKDGSIPVKDVSLGHVNPFNPADYAAPVNNLPTPNPANPPVLITRPLNPEEQSVVNWFKDPHNVFKDVADNPGWNVVGGAATFFAAKGLKKLVGYVDEKYNEYKKQREI